MMPPHVKFVPGHQSQVSKRLGIADRSDSAGCLAASSIRKPQRGKQLNAHSASALIVIGAEAHHSYCATAISQYRHQTSDRSHHPPNPIYSADAESPSVYNHVHSDSDSDISDPASPHREANDTDSPRKSSVAYCRNVVFAGIHGCSTVGALDLACSGFVWNIGCCPHSKFFCVFVFSETEIRTLGSAKIGRKEN